MISANLHAQERTPTMYTYLLRSYTHTHTQTHQYLFVHVYNMRITKYPDMNFS